MTVAELSDATDSMIEKFMTDSNWRCEEFEYVIETSNYALDNCKQSDHIPDSDFFSYSNLSLTIVRGSTSKSSLDLVSGINAHGYCAHGGEVCYVAFDFRTATQ